MKDAMKYLFKAQQAKLTGFTLIELMIIMAISGILAMAASSVGDVLSKHTINSPTALLKKSIILARESDRGPNPKHIVICSSIDGQRCANSDQWEMGWIVFRDDNDDGILNNLEKLLEVQAGFDRNLTITSSTLTQPGIIKFNKFKQPNTSGEFVFCNNKGAQKATALIMTSIGFVREAVDENNDNIANTANGNNLSC